MALIEVQAREKAVKVAKTKAIRVDESLQESVGLYREFLVSEQGADPKKFSDERIIVALLAEAMKGDKDFQGWIKSRSQSTKPAALRVAS